MFALSKQKSINIFVLALLLFFFNCSKMLKNKNKLGWSSRWRLLTDNDRKVLLWSTEKLCENECPKKECYRFKRYDDYAKFLPKEFGDPYVCFFKEEKEIFKWGRPRETRGLPWWEDWVYRWEDESECNAFCRGVKRHLCGYRPLANRPPYYGCEMIKVNQRKDYLRLVR
jgi:hypothetical protein